MKYSAAIIAFAGFAAAQTFADLPVCARDCLSTAITANGKCQITNTACLCNPDNFKAIFSNSTVCVLQSCGSDSAVNQVIPAATSICAAVASSAAVVSGSSAVSVAASSAVVATSTRASAVTSSAVSSAIGTISSPITSAPRSGITRTSIVTSTITSMYNGNFTRSPTQVPVTVNGAAVQGPIGIAAAIALGALAYL